MAAFVVAVFSLFLITIIEQLVGIKYEEDIPGWKQIMHRIMYAVWGVAVASAHLQGYVLFK
jgi:hypothetical protein